MIRFLEGELLPQWEAACRLEPVFGGKLEALLAVYGMNSPHCDFWVALDGDGLPAGGVGREGDTLTLALSQSVDTEELTQFLAAVGGSWAEGRDPYLSSLAERCGCAPRSAPLLEYRGPSPPWAAREADRLTDVYPVSYTHLTRFWGRRWSGDWSPRFRQCSSRELCAGIWRNIRRFCGSEGRICWFW